MRACVPRETCGRSTWHPSTSARPRRGSKQLRPRQQQPSRSARPVHFPPAALVPAATTGLIPGVLLVVPPSVACCDSGHPRALLYGTLPSLGALGLSRHQSSRREGNCLWLASSVRAVRSAAVPSLECPILCARRLQGKRGSDTPHGYKDAENWAHCPASLSSPRPSSLAPLAASQPCCSASGAAHPKRTTPFCTNLGP